MSSIFTSRRCISPSRNVKSVCDKSDSPEPPKPVVPPGVSRLDDVWSAELVAGRAPRQTGNADEPQKNNWAREPIRPQLWFHVKRRPRSRRTHPWSAMGSSSRLDSLGRVPGTHRRPWLNFRWKWAAPWEPDLDARCLARRDSWWASSQGISAGYDWPVWPATWGSEP